MIAQKMLEVKDLVGTFRTLGLFIASVILVTRRNPYKFINGLSRALLQGIATSSSAASLPVTFECVRDMNLDPRVAKFVLTVGTILA
ncbi:hypothetical protein GCK32_020826, partial [Trichostrongylus colubriformis]